MCIIGDIIEGFLLGKVTVATKPSDYEVTNIWSIRHINTLPRELLLSIFRYLSYSELTIAMVVCKEWRDVAEDPVLWRKYKLAVGRKHLESLKNILSLRRFECLQHLEVNGYGNKEITVIDQGIMTNITDTSISKLTLKNCDLTQISKENLSLLLSELRSLSLWQVDMRKEDVASLFQTITRSKRLQELDIGYAYLELDDVSPELLAKALNRRRTVNLCHARLSQPQLTSLFEAISRKTTIKTLDVGYRDLSFLDPKILKAALEKLENVNICPKKFITTPYIFSHKATIK